MTDCVIASEMKWSVAICCESPPSLEPEREAVEDHCECDEVGRGNPLMTTDCFIPLRSIRNDAPRKRHCERNEMKRGNLSANDELAMTTRHNRHQIASLRSQ